MLAIKHTATWTCDTCGATELIEKNVEIFSDCPRSFIDAPYGWQFVWAPENGQLCFCQACIEKSKHDT